MTSDSLVIDVRGQEMIFCAAKCLVWPQEKLLVVADLHLGKSETFQLNGLWLPPQSQFEDLNIIKVVARRHAVSRLLFLGDLVHSKAGITTHLQAVFGDWLDSWKTEFGGEVMVAVGNHDRALVKSWPTLWQEVNLIDRLEMTGFVFQHEPPTAKEIKKDDSFFWIGHVHPVVVLSKGPDRLRLPCFVIDHDIGYLPAFSSLAGGYNMALTSNDTCRKDCPSQRKIYALGNDQVFAV